jgi:hypothetical protein
MGHEVARTRYPFHNFLLVADWHLSEVEPPLKVRALFMAASSRQTDFARASDPLSTNQGAAKTSNSPSCCHTVYFLHTLAPA